MKNKKRKRKFIIPKEPEDYTFGKHKTKRKTMVMIDNIIYDLVPTDLTIKGLMRKNFKEVPHVRLLNPIPIRTEEEQAKEEQENEKLHKLSQEVNGSGDKDKVTSLKKAAKMGANVGEEVEKLLQEKKIAQKDGDKSRCQAIRKKLRRLDYHRFEEQGVKETTSRKERKREERTERRKKRKLYAGKG